MKTYLTIDVGGTAIKYALINEKLKFIRKGEVPTPYAGLDVFVKTIVDIYHEYGQETEGIAMSMPGAIDPAIGYLHTGGALNDFMHDVNMVEQLHKYVDKPVTIGNDAKCAAQAELGYGALKDYDDSAVMILGTGVGGALIHDHKVLIGKHFFAGEFSYVNTDIEHPYDLQLWAGQRCSTSGLISFVQQKTGQKMNGREIFAKANESDPLVLAGLEEYCDNVTVFLYNLVAIFDPEAIAIGGGISAQPLLFEKLNEAIKKHEKRLFYPMPIPKIIPCQFHNDANLFGALYQFRTTYK